MIVKRGWLCRAPCWRCLPEWQSRLRPGIPLALRCHFPPSPLNCSPTSSMANRHLPASASAIPDSTRPSPLTLAVLHPWLAQMRRLNV